MEGLKAMRLNENTFYCGTGAYTLMLDRANARDDVVLMCAMDKSSHHYFGVVEIGKMVPLLQAHNRNICELLTEYPKRVYFDIDALGIPKNSFTVDDVLTMMKKHFGFNQDDVTVAGYITDEKTSYHVAAINHYIHNPDEMDRLKQLVTYVKSSGGHAQYLDDKVYTKNRQMKCIYQSKPGGTIAMPLHPKNHKNIYDFFIVVHNEETPSYFDTVKIPLATITSLKIDVHPEPVKKALEIPNYIVMTSDITNPKNILKMIPSEKELSHAHRWKVANFCYFNAISEAEYMAWFMLSKPSAERIKKVARFWKNPALSNPEYAVTVRSMLKYLSNWYPDLADDNHNTDAFIKSFNLDVKNHKVIDMLDHKCFEGGSRAIIANFPMGGGKTTATLDYLNRNPKKSFVWLAPRQTLVLNTSHRMSNEFSIKHITHLEVGKDKHKLKTAERLLICNQSLHHLEPEQRFDVVVIDEIETVLLSWLDEDTHKEKMGDNFRRFCDLLRNAPKIILLDAFTTTKTLKLLNNLGITSDKILLYSGGKTPKEKQMVINKTIDEMTSKIVDAYFRGEKSYIFYPYKKGTEKSHYGIVEYDNKLKALIKERKLKDATTDAQKLKIHEESSAESLVYFAESHEKNNLGDINESWARQDYILTTSSITVGVNYEGLDFHNVFLMMSGRTNNPRDVIQSSMRVRYPQCEVINIHFFDTKEKDLKKFPKYYHDDDDIYKALVVENLREIQAGFIETFNRFCAMANYKFDATLLKTLEAKRKKKFINDMYESSQLIEYSKVPVLDDDEREQREFKVYNRQATVADRLAVDRFYFDITFRNLEADDRALIWNTNSRQFFRGINSDIVPMICRDNGVEKLIDIDLKKFEVSKEVIGYIKKHYSITEFKKPDWVVVRVLNDAIGFDGITSKKDKRNKHIHWEFSSRFDLLNGINETKKTNDDKAYAKIIDDEADEDASAKVWERESELYWADVTEDDMILVQSDIGEYWTCSKPRK
jgi:hypothetical protein